MNNYFEKHSLIRLLYTNCFAFVALILISGCRGDEPKRIPDTMPDVYGAITEVVADTDDRAKAVVMVRAIEGVEAKFPEASITIDDETLIEDSRGEELKLEHLREGQEIQAWFEGDVMESMPVQGYVKAIRIKAP